MKKEPKVVYIGGNHFTICDGVEHYNAVTPTYGIPDLPMVGLYIPITGRWHCENCGKKENCKCSFCETNNL